MDAGGPDAVRAPVARPALPIAGAVLGAFVATGAGAASLVGGLVEVVHVDVGTPSSGAGAGAQPR